MIRAAFLVLVWAPASLMAGMTTMITDTQPIIDWPLCRCGLALPASLDFALFDYSNQPKLCGIDSIQFTMTIEDGDTGVGQFDANKLFLGLDNVNTGLALNGFQTGQENTLSFTLDRAAGLTDATIQQILDNLNDDGQLFASIIDTTPDDNNVNLYSVFDTSLNILGTTCINPDPNGVPEPTAIAVWGVIGAAGMIYSYRRKRVRSNH